MAEVVTLALGDGAIADGVGGAVMIAGGARDAILTPLRSAGVHHDILHRASLDTLTATDTLLRREPAARIDAPLLVEGIDHTRL